MSKEYVWGPSFFGRVLTGSSPWLLRLANGRFHLIVDNESVVIGWSGRDRLAATRGVLWGSLRYAGGVLGGLPNSSVAGLNDVIADVIRAQERQEAERLLQTQSQKDEQIARFRTSYSLLRSWLSDANRLLNDSRTQRRWVTHEQQVALQAARPSLPIADNELDVLLHDEALRDALGVPLIDVQRALAIWRGDWSALWKKINKEHTESELVASKWLLSNVEKLPLNDEQARAVICFDNRVQVAASAGSGKTSTMVAKAAYAIDRGFFQPKEIVIGSSGRPGEKQG
ncbi:UvrD-helicase domain-containing protein [Pseudomonas sp. YQ_6]|uniref:UvrD-helicase domain-containing protein n=1 Tax=Pseudomonas sp. YQ_6 TaxID=3367230 RepID=UPI00370BAC68